MSEGVFGHISKGPIHRKVDAVVNDPAQQFQKRRTFLNAIKAAATSDDYLTVLKTQAGVTQAEAKYLHDTWYELGPKGLWPWLQPIYPILKTGLIKAIEEAGVAQGGPNLPLDSYWAPACSQVEVMVLHSLLQVTRIILTPGTPAPMRNRPNRVPIWNVRRGSALEAQGTETEDEFIELVQGNVITYQSKDL